MSAGQFLRNVQLLRRYELTSQRGIKNSEFEAMNVFEFGNISGTQLNIQMTRPDQYISGINPES